MSVRPAAVALFDQPAALRDDDSVRPAGDVQLGEYRFDMGLNGACCDALPQCDRLVAQSQHHLPEYDQLCARQGAAAKRLGNPARNHRGQGDAPVANDANALYQLRQTAAEEEIATHTPLERVANLRLAVTVGENQHTSAQVGIGLNESQP